MTKLPATMFLVVAQYSGFPGGELGNCCDPVDTQRAAEDAAYEFIDDDPNGALPRVFRLDFDLETNALETAREITDEALRAIADRYAETATYDGPGGFPASLMGYAPDWIKAEREAGMNADRRAEDRHELRAAI